MAETPMSPGSDDEANIADAHLLFHDESAGPARAADAGPAAGRDVGGTYEVEEVEDPPARPPSGSIPSAPPRPKPRPKPERRAGPALEPSEAVEQVWSRGAEWGGTLALLAVVAVVLGPMISVAMTQERFGLAVFLLLVGGATLVVLSYPSLITLERPTRVTPEQAVKDYYAALSHHFPHYRRMWLLLSAAGRSSRSFASFEGFKNFWKARRGQLRARRAGKSTALQFQVVDFRSEKSAGQTVIDAKFTVQVLVRGRLEEGPVESIRVETSLVRGPDRMWYLDQGTLPSAGA